MFPNLTVKLQALTTKGLELLFIRGTTQIMAELSLTMEAIMAVSQILKTVDLDSASRESEPELPQARDPQTVKVKTNLSSTSMIRTVKLRTVEKGTS